jgi:hypothetical protein
MWSQTKRASFRGLLLVEISQDGYYTEPLAEFSQGDILEAAPNLTAVALDADKSVMKTAIGQFRNDEMVVAYGSSRALILTPDCEIEKPWSKKLMICPIGPLDELSQAQRGDAKRGRIAHLFFLPRYKDRLTDSVAFLNHVTVVDRNLVKPVTRIATLHTLGRKALYAQFLRWMSRWELAEAQCPQCETIFDPNVAQPTRAPEDA